MAKKTNRAEHPLSTVITHWIHIVALFVLIVTASGSTTRSPTGDSTPCATCTCSRRSSSWHRDLPRLLGVLRPRAHRRGGARGSRTGTSSSRRRRTGHVLAHDRVLPFLRKTHPCTAKYNPLQKAGLRCAAVAIILDAFHRARDVARHAGVLRAHRVRARRHQAIRQMHYMAMWMFIVITAAMSTSSPSRRPGSSR